MIQEFVTSTYDRTEEGLAIVTTGKCKAIKQIINEDIGNIDYPMGDSIQDNIPRIKIMIETFQSIKKFRNKFVNIICRGSSGAIIAAYFAQAIKNSKIVYLRKDKEFSHTYEVSIISNKNSINIIVDDFVNSGRTIKEIYNTLCDNSTTGKVTIHCVCVSKTIYSGDFNFVPEYTVSARVFNIDDCLP